jgi:hypothetical protein
MKVDAPAAGEVASWLGEGGAGGWEAIPHLSVFVFSFLHCSNVLT